MSEWIMSKVESKLGHPDKVIPFSDKPQPHPLSLDSQEVRLRASLSWMMRAGEEKKVLEEILFTSGAKRCESRY